MGATAAAVAEWWGTAEAATATAAAAETATAGSAALTSAATAAATVAATSLLMPKPDKPGEKPATPMPDPEAQQAAARKMLIEQTARSGRASTVLTNPGGGTLG